MRDIKKYYFDEQQPKFRFKQALFEHVSNKTALLDIALALAAKAFTLYTRLLQDLPYHALEFVVTKKIRDELQNITDMEDFYPSEESVSQSPAYRFVRYAISENGEKSDEFVNQQEAALYAFSYGMYYLQLYTKKLKLEDHILWLPQKLLVDTDSTENYIDKMRTVASGKNYDISGYISQLLNAPKLINYPNAALDAGEINPNCFAMIMKFTDDTQVAFVYGENSSYYLSHGSGNWQKCGILDFGDRMINDLHDKLTDADDTLFSQEPVNQDSNWYE